MTQLPTLMRGFSCLLLLTGVSACTYLIPDDVSVPRNNIVQGDRHKPLRQNVAPQNGANVQQNPTMQMVAAAPVMPVMVNPLSTPVPSSIQYPQFTDTTASDTPSRIATLDRISTPIPPADLTALQPVAAAGGLRADTTALGQAPAITGAAARRTPSENASILADRRMAAPNPVVAASGSAPFQVAANDAVSQGLIAVPPRPPLNGPDSAYSQMGVARKDMEKSRTDTFIARQQMDRDVAAEPSVFSKPAISSNSPEILSPLPANVAPLAVPNKTSLPTPVMVPSSPVPPSVAPVPVPTTTRIAPAPTSSLVAPMPVASAMPLAPLAPVASPVMAKAPLPAASGLPPIALKNPVPLDVASAKPALPALPSRSGRGFNPMAALPQEQPVAQLPAIALTPPASVEPVIDQASTNTSILATSAFNPLNSDVKGTRQTQYLSPSRYADR